MNIKKSKLKEIVSGFRNNKVLVVGDLILDRHIFGNVNRISPEAPVPVVWAQEEQFTAGGAANVGMNLVDLGAKVSLCGLIGKDNFGRQLYKLLRKKKIDTEYILRDNFRRTTLKTRVIAHHQQIVRVDWESTDSLPQQITKNLLAKLKNKLSGFDAIIIEDYGKGVINPLLIEKIISLSAKKEKIITVDPKEDHFRYYRNVTALTPNLAEAQTAAGIKAKNKNQIKIIGKKLLNRLKSKSILLTLGEEGMMLFSRQKVQHIPTAALEVYDVTGAGDTVISVFTLALANKASFYQAAWLANIAAGSVVGKLGATTIKKDELIKLVDEKRN